ncbi:MAG TPA: rhomboid family intramembrane serine protease [Verrucomicrobiae bacterium]|nr:rhomboid family intramembrane serine protease [Verrucomicrobiae bacterium]
MNTEPAFIPARSRRQVMDWGLVLASQGIDAAIVREQDTWALSVSSADYERACAMLNQYVVENRGWKWQQSLPGSGLFFHWGSLLWALAVGAIYYWSMVLFPQMKMAGVMDSQLIREGQWWRLFTAVTLHADMSHLLANMTTGIILLGFAMARFGPGPAVLATYIAGVLGNVADLFLYHDEHRSLGASGMVMAALGILAVQSFSLWHKDHSFRQLIARAFVAALLILILIGTSPESDVVAHFGGFFAGALFGYALSWINPDGLKLFAVNFVTIVITMFLVAITWWKAKG